MLSASCLGMKRKCVEPPEPEAEPAGQPHLDNALEILDLGISDSSQRSDAAQADHHQAGSSSSSAAAQADHQTGSSSSSAAAQADQTGSSSSTSVHQTGSSSSSAAAQADQTGSSSSHSVGSAGAQADQRPLPPIWDDPREPRYLENARNRAREALARENEARAREIEAIRRNIRANAAMGGLSREDIDAAMQRGGNIHNAMQIVRSLARDRAVQQLYYACGIQPYGVHLERPLESDDELDSDECEHE